MKSSGLDTSRGPNVSERGAAETELSADLVTTRYYGLIAFFLVYGFIFLSRSEFALRDPDTLWHIRTGRWILENGRWPYSDVFSHTFFGQPWMAKEWLSQLVLALAYQLGGWRGVVALASLLYAAIGAALTVYLTRILRFSVAIGLAGVTLLLINPHLLARPHLLAYPILAVWLIVLLDSVDRDRAPPPGLAALMLLWANVHSSCVLGLVLLHAVAGLLFIRFVRNRDSSAATRTLLAVLLVTIAATVTPYGASPLILTWHTMGMKSMMANLTEWQPPNFREYPAAMVYLVGFILVITGFGIRLCLPRLALLAIAAWIGFSYARGFFLFLLIVPLIVARPAARQVAFLRAQEPGKTDDPVLRFFRREARGITLICCGLAAFATLFTWHFRDLEPSLSIAPNGAVNYARLANLGKVFNSYDFGGYLIFAGVPTYVDGRADLYGDEFLKEYFETVNLRDPQASLRLLDDQKIDYAILRPSEPLAKALVGFSTWRPDYSDQSAIVFVRSQ